MIEEFNLASNFLIQTKFISGQDNNDTLYGWFGNDKLSGGSGADSLRGDDGADTLTGGTGADRFVFNDSSEGIDSISDFNPSDDTIELSQFGFSLPAGTLAASRFFIGSSAVDSNDRIIYDSTNGDLFFDSNGSRSGGAVQIASLDSGLGLTAADFDVV